MFARLLVEGLSQRHDYGVKLRISWLIKSNFIK